MLNDNCLHYKHSNYFDISTPWLTISVFVLLSMSVIIRIRFNGLINDIKLLGYLNLSIYQTKKNTGESQR